jgi:acyl-CoA thioesterase
VDRTVAEIAAANECRYSTNIHLQHDPAASEAFAATHVRRLEAIRRSGRCAAPGAMILFREPAPISTITWSIDMLDADPTSATGWWLVQCTAETARLGYSAQSTLIWNADGRPILAARQNVAIFA